MNFRNKENLKTSPVSAASKASFLEPKRPSLVLIYFFIFLMAVTFVIFTGIGWYIWESYHKQRAAVEGSVKLLDAAGQISMLDEAMTSSARLAAASHDFSWKERFAKYQAEQKMIISKLKILVSNSKNKQDVSHLDEVDAQMLRFEEKALRLAKDGFFADALVALDSDEYLELKNEFTKDLKKVSKDVKASAYENMRRLKNWVLFTGVALAYVALIYIFVWGLIIHRLRLYLKDRDFLEIALRREKDKAQLYLESAGVVLVVINENEKISMINQRGCEILGYSRRELIGKNWFDMVVPKSMVENMRKIFHRLLEQEEGLFGYFENPVLTKSNDIKMLGWHNNIIKDDSGRVVGAISSGEDVTKRKTSEETSRRLSTMYQTLSDINKAMLHIREAQPLFEEVCRLAVETGTFKMAWVGLFDPKTQMIRPAARFGAGIEALDRINISAGDDIDKQGLAGRAFLEGKYCVSNDIRTDPRLFSFRDTLLEAGYCSSAAFPIWRSGGAIGTFTFFSHQPDYFKPEQIDLLQELSANISFALDFMDQQKGRTQAEESLESSLKNWQVTFDATHDAIMVLNKNFEVLKANRAMVKLLKKSHEEIIGRHCYEMVHGTSHPYEDCPLQKMLQSKKYEESELYFPERDMWAWVNASPIFDSTGEIEMAVHTIRDITSHKKIEEEIKKEKCFNDVTIDTIPGVFYVLNSKGRFVRWNKTEEQLIGRPPQEIYGMDALLTIHEEDRDAVAAKIREAFECGYAEITARVLWASRGTPSLFLTGKKMEIGTEIYLIGVGTELPHPD